jgi:hypothetical protein
MGAEDWDGILSSRCVFDGSMIVITGKSYGGEEFE